MTHSDLASGAAPGREQLLAICPRCGRIFAPTAGAGCPTCGFPLSAILARPSDLAPRGGSPADDRVSAEGSRARGSRH